jgi:hypothetical protein
MLGIWPVSRDINVLIIPFYADEDSLQFLCLWHNRLFTPQMAGFVYPDAHLEMRQGARIILGSKEERGC